MEIIMILPTIEIPEVTLLRLQEKHLGEVIDLMNMEGWYYYDYHELRRYLIMNQDCFTLMKNDRIIGSIFTTNYENQVWIGNIVIAKEERGRGLGYKLITTVMEYLHKNGNVLTFRLGAVPLAIGLYKKAGFHAESFTTAQVADLPLSIEHDETLFYELTIEHIDKAIIKSISEIDKAFFKSDRFDLLMSIYSDSVRESCLYLKDKNKVVGFLMIRRRKASKTEGHFAEGPDYAYRLGPCCVLPEYGIKGFKALMQRAITAVNREVSLLEGSAKIYVVFPRNADKEDIFKDTSELAVEMGVDTDVERVFDEHDHIFGAEKSIKNDEQWKYMESLGFKQEYFEQVMSFSPGDRLDTRILEQSRTTQADTEGIFATATPGDKG